MGIGRVQNVINRHNIEAKAPQTLPKRDPKVNVLCVGTCEIAY